MKNKGDYYAAVSLMMQGLQPADIADRLQVSRSTVVSWYSKFKAMLWLEPKPKNKRIRKWVKMLSYAVKLFPVKGRFLSPFIVVYARK